MGAWSKISSGAAPEGARCDVWWHARADVVAMLAVVVPTFVGAMTLMRGRPPDIATSMARAVADEKAE